MPRGATVALALTLLLASCAQDGQPQAESSAQPSEVQSSPGAPSSTDAPASAADVPENLAFTADLVGGGQLDAGDLQGRDVVLWFWAPW